MDVDFLVVLLGSHCLHLYLNVLEELNISTSMAGQRNNYGKRGHFHSDYPENGGSKRRNPGDDRDQFSIGSEDTVYRYLCPVAKIGSIIGRGGEIVKQLRVDTKAKIRISDTVPDCSERVVMIYSNSEETNDFGDSENRVCPAQDALFRVHDKVVADESNPDDEPEGEQHVTAKLLVPSDQIGCVIGKGGQIVQSIRTDTAAQIRILKDNHLPNCALGSDELVQISGEASRVRRALYEIASRLHDNPSKSQHLLASAAPPSGYGSSSSLLGSAAGPPIIGYAPSGSYGGYKPDTGGWPRSLYSGRRDDSSMKEFSLRLVCPTGIIGGVIGKGGATINQIRQETRSIIKVDSSSAEDDCLITISTKEYFEDPVSPTLEAARRLQPRCSERVERDSGIISFTTRLLVPTSRIGCLLGKGGSIITEMRKVTKANIRILSKDDVPKVAAEDDEMVQISGDLDVAETALAHIATRLRANLFEKEAYMPVVPYVPMSTDASDGLGYEDRDSRRHSRSYSSGYGGSGDLTSSDPYGSYGLQSGGASSGYGAYGGYSGGRSYLARPPHPVANVMDTRYMQKVMPAESSKPPEACILPPLMKPPARTLKNR
ncbi:KH domain-containing protein [Drosera capensis]